MAQRRVRLGLRPPPVSPFLSIAPSSQAKTGEIRLVCTVPSHKIVPERLVSRRLSSVVRLACLTTPEWAQGHVGAFSLPKGAAWPALIGVIRRNWSESESEPEKALLVLGLVEDWAKGVSLKEPYPERLMSAIPG
jgi:hypothetical protein